MATEHARTLSRELSPDDLSPEDRARYDVLIDLSDQTMSMMEELTLVRGAIHREIDALLNPPEAAAARVVKTLRTTVRSHVFTAQMEAGAP